MNTLFQYFCCCCGPPPKSRKEIREEWEAKQKLIDEKIASSKSKKESTTVPSSAQSVTTIEPSTINFNGKEIPKDKIMNIIKLQALIRKILGKRKAFNRYQELLEEANEYWRYILSLRDEAERIRRIREQARKDFTYQYAKDVMDTSILFILQADEASTHIQRLWRGYSTRKRLPPKPKRKERVGKVKRRKRFSAATLRRVWARSQFEPSTSTYLHHTDFGYLEYDLWEHTKSPPKGEDVGLINRQVKLPVKSDAKEIILLHDRHAWVGLPIDYDTPSEKEAWKKAKLPNNVKNMIFNSPYKRPLLTEEERKSLKQSPTKRRATSPSPMKRPESPPEELYPFPISPGSPVPHPEMNENEQLDYLKKIGYDEKMETSIRLPGMPRIGSQQYDPMTGRLLVYRGNGKWKRVMTDSYVNFGKEFHAMDENLPISNMDSIASDSTSLIIPPKFTETKAGWVYVENEPLINPQSPFRQKHKQTYQELFQTGQSHNVSSAMDSPQISPKKKEKSTVLTTNKIINSFLTNVVEAEHDYEPDENVANNNDTKFRYSEQTGTPFRQTQKIPYLALQLRAKQQDRYEDEYSSKGKKRKTKKQEAQLKEALSWSKTKGFVETLHNDMIRKNPILSQQLMDLIYSTENDNEKLFNSLFTDRNDLLREHSRQFLPISKNFTPSDDSKQEISRSLIESDVYDEEEMGSLWKRSVYRKPKEIVPRVVVWNKPSSKHYHLKYTWIPQPLVNNAVNEIFYNRSYRDIHAETKEIYREERITNKDKENELKETLINIIQPSPRKSPPPTGFTDIREESTFLPAPQEADLQSKISSLHSISDDSFGTNIQSFYDPETRSVINKEKPKTFISSMPDENDDLSSFVSNDGSSQNNNYYLNRERSFPSFNEFGQSTVSIRHSLSNHSISFPKFLKSYKPGEITRHRYILESSAENVNYQEESFHRKFRYKPISSKHAKIIPEMHPYDWH